MLFYDVYLSEAKTNVFQNVLRSAAIFHNKLHALARRTLIFSVVRKDDFIKWTKKWSPVF